MAITKKQLRAKAAGMYTGVTVHAQKNPSHRPDALLAQDYNSLRDLTAQTVPELEAVLPPQVEIVRSTEHGDWVRTYYGDLLSYITQIANLLEDE